MRPHRGARAARGVLVALFATFVALMSHVAGGGEVPGWLGLLGPLILAAAASTLLVGRQVSLWRLGMAVGASQLLFHTMFTLGGPEGASAAHGHHHSVAGIADVIAPAEHAHGAGQMWMAHAIAAAITIAGIYVGERSVLVAGAAVAGAQSWLRRTVATTEVSSPVPVTAPARLVAGAVRVLRSLCVLSQERRRGPPLASGI